MTFHTQSATQLAHLCHFITYANIGLASVLKKTDQNISHFPCFFFCLTIITVVMFTKCYHRRTRDNSLIWLSSALFQTANHRPHVTGQYQGFLPPPSSHQKGEEARGTRLEVSSVRKFHCDLINSNHQKLADLYLAYVIYCHLLIS